MKKGFSPSSNMKFLTRKLSWNMSSKHETSNVHYVTPIAIALLTNNTMWTWNQFLELIPAKRESNGNQNKIYVSGYNMKCNEVHVCVGLQMHQACVKMHCSGAFSPLRFPSYRALCEWITWWNTPEIFIKLPRMHDWMMIYVLSYNIHVDSYDSGIYHLSKGFWIVRHSTWILLLVNIKKQS